MSLVGTSAHVWDLATSRTAQRLSDLSDEPIIGVIRNIPEIDWHIGAAPFFPIAGGVPALAIAFGLTQREFRDFEAGAPLPL